MRCAHRASDAATSAASGGGGRRVALSILLGGLFFMTSAASAATNGAIYKCREADGSVLYADYPCKGNVVVDIKPDAANPAAIDRLQRAQAEFDRSYSERMARENDLAIRREQLALRRLEAEASQTSESFGGYAGDWGYVPAYGFYGGNYDGLNGKARDNRSHRDHPEHHRKDFEHRVPAVIHRPMR